jgi:hypothetical protein
MDIGLMIYAFGWLLVGIGVLVLVWALLSEGDDSNGK